MITKRLGVAGRKQGTTARGAKRIERFARSIGSHVSLENGSGLSRIDRASAHNVVDLLSHMNRVHAAGVYRRSLARPCATGTVADRMCGTAAAHGCHVKTGTLADVSALSGYCDAKRHRIGFGILMNSVTNFDVAHHTQDRMAALISRYRP
jgi:D-alanyl-D-alanine carboxypeptidase/D-alanyl-D-alanine-endopeptidase (penicillin-binding protein 4)